MLLKTAKLKKIRIREGKVNIEGEWRANPNQTQKPGRWGDRPAKKYYGLRQENRNLNDKV